MIKIGTKKDLPLAMELPLEVQQSIFEDIKILDQYYGVDREVDTSMGGFVCVIESDDDKKYLSEKFHLSIGEDIFEYKETICTYTKKLFLIGTEFSILTYEGQTHGK